MKNFIIEILGILVVLLGGAFLLKGKNPFKKKHDIIEPPIIRPILKPPDVEKIKEEFKNETPQESVDHITRLLDELFPNG